MIRKGIHHERLWSRISLKVFDGAEKVFVTRCNCVRPGSGEGAAATGGACISLMISPLKKPNLAAYELPLPGGDTLLAQRASAISKTTELDASPDRMAQRRRTFDRDCNPEGLCTHNQFAWLR